MPAIRKRTWIAAVVALIVVALLVTLVVISPGVAHRMEPYRQTPPEDTTIHVPMEHR